MRDILSDVVKQTASLFEVVKVVGTDDATKLSAVDASKTLFLQAALRQPIPEFAGEWGLSNLPLLNGLLNFASYKTDDATFRVKRGARNGVEFVEQFEFRDAKGKGADFRAMSAALVGEQAVIANIPWDVSVTPSKAKVAEFSQLASIFGEVSKGYFGVQTEDGDLVFNIGDDTSSTHRVSLVFESDVQGALKGDLIFSINQFLSVLKLAGTNKTTVNITSRGVLGVVVETDHATYSYYMRAKR